MSASLLTVEDLHAWRGESHIVQGISFETDRDGVTALLGRNGVGKTTTLRGLLGLLRRQGRIELDGIDLSRMPTHRIVSKGIGYVPEDRDVFSALTVAENLRLAERDRKPDYGRVYALFPELRERLRQRAGTLSGGQQQMLAIARVLLNDNRMYLIDEPTKGLAPILVERVRDALRAIAASTPVLLVEQDLRLVTSLARQAIVIDDGRLAYAGPMTALIADQPLLHRLLGVGFEDSGIAP